jgi:DNA-binding beta-propeller fold protein YncE
MDEEGPRRIRKTWLLISALAFVATLGSTQQSSPLRLLETTTLRAVQGRIDHFDVDLAGQRLFMSALGNNTLEVFNLHTNKPVHTIGGLHEPQGVTYVPKSHRIFVANGEDGTVRIFDGSTYQLLKSVHFPSDADDTRYDAVTNRVLVGFGDEGDAGLAILDGGTGEWLETVKLPAHPESFQLEESGPLIYVNLPSAGNIVDVVDRNKRRIVATWKLGGAQDNFPMALDEVNHRLFIGCRTPAEVLVLDTDSGKIIARLPSVTHADDLWYDAAHNSIYVSGGGGFITVIAQLNANHYRRVTQIKTPPGARTSCLVPQLNRFYLGVWGHPARPAELRVYQVQP